MGFKPLEALLLLTLLVFSTSLLKAEEQLNVAFILPLSGEHAGVCEGIQKGLELGLSELPAELRRKINVYYEDDQFSPQKSLLAFKRVVQQHDIDLILNASAPTGHPIAPVSEKLGIPFISLSSDRALVQGRERTFLFWVTPERIAEKTVEELKRRGFTRLARINAMNEGRLYLKQQLNKAGGEELKYLLDEDYNLSERDFRNYLTRLKAEQGVQAVLVNLFFGQIGLFARQAAELGIDLPIFGFEMMADPREIEQAQGALDGQVFISESLGGSAFVKKFEKAYPHASRLGAAYGYALVDIFKHLLTYSTKRGQIPKILRELKDFETVFGKISVSPDKRFDFPAVITPVAPSR